MLLLARYARSAAITRVINLPNNHPSGFLRFRDVLKNPNMYTELGLANVANTEHIWCIRQTRRKYLAEFSSALRLSYVTALCNR